MIFPASNPDPRPIAPTLRSIAQHIEEHQPGLYVLAAREFRYPVQQQQITVKAELRRKINLLEKFILRAFVEVSPTPTLEELADVLGLNPIFIKSTFHDLVERQNITDVNNNRLVTEEGKKFLASEEVVQEPTYERWYLLQDTILNAEVFSRRPLDEVDEAFEDLNPYVQKDLTRFPAFELNVVKLLPQLQDLGLSLHDPDEGRFVTEMAATAPPELCWKRIALFVLHDTLSDSPDTAITFQARLEGETIPLIGAWLEAQLQKKKLSLKTLCGLTDDIIAQEVKLSTEKGTEKRLEEIRQQATTQQRLQAKGQTPEKDTGTAIQLRDVKIRPAFLQALREAREHIIIYSPWVNEQVVDEEFLTLLENRVQQGVRILIGYGIGRDEKKEERPIPASLPQRLRTIQTAEGTPGIIAEWLGNSHAKEIVVDRKIHLSGSHNWLSYRGDRFPRGETVYYVTIPAEIEKAYAHLSQRFIERAQALWLRATDEECRLALCILGYLGYEQEALTWIQREKYYHFIPLWLALVHQAISSKHATRILTPLQAAITLCATMELRDALKVEIVTALQKVLDTIKLKNRELATTLASANILQFQRLGLDPQSY